MSNPMAAVEIAPVPSPVGANAGAAFRLVDAGEHEGRDVAQVILQMLRDGAAEVSFSLPAFPAANEPEGSRTLEPGADRMGDQAAKVLFSAVAELRRCERTGTLIFKLVQSPLGDDAARAEHPGAGLQKWRLKRAIDFIDANLENSISLNDLSAAAGLSPSYFGAQFRTATGLRPYEYVLRERIRRAQDMLRDPKVTIIEAAISVGFQTQAHFTTTFKRFVGAPPSRWRQDSRIEA